MKLLSAFLGLVLVALLPANLHADTVNLTIDGRTVVGTLIANGFNFTYVNTTLGVLDNSLLQSSTSVVTATYVDVLGTLGVFNFTDICTKVTVLGPVVPCQDLAISFTDLTVGDASVAAALAANINVGVGVGDISIAGANLVPNFGLLGVSVVGASGEIDFQNPPPAVPEPGTLSLMATGLLAAAGAIRRKFGKHKICKTTIPTAIQRVWAVRTSGPLFPRVYGAAYEEKNCVALDRNRSVTDPAA